MKVVEEKIRKRVIVDAPSAPAAMPISHERREPLGGPADGERKEVTEFLYRDSAGTLIKGNTPMVIDAKTGRPTALWNSFLCDTDNQYHSITDLQEYTDMPIDPEPMAAIDGGAAPDPAGADPNTAVNADTNADVNHNGPRVRHGICKSCHEADRWHRRVVAGLRCLLWLGRIILAPFLPETTGTQNQGGGNI